MKLTVEKLKEGLIDVFPDIEAIEVTADTLLAEIPGWDSMSSVNLQVYLEEHYGVVVNQNLLNEDAKISDVIAMIEQIGA